MRLHWKFAWFATITALLAVVLAIISIYPAQADFVRAVVGTGTAASCNETNFNSALATVQAQEEGEIVFNCGGPATIVFTAQKVITSQLLSIDGGNQITLSGDNSARLFYVKDANLNLVNITLMKGNGYDLGGGAILADTNSNVSIRKSTIQNNRTNVGAYGSAILSYDKTEFSDAVTIVDSIIQNNTGTGAAVNVVGNLSIVDSHFAGNKSFSTDGPQLGGALAVGGTTDIENTTFELNEAKEGGAVYATSSAVVTVIGGSFRQNRAINGGAIYNHGVLRTTDVTLINNAALNHGGALYNTKHTDLESSTLVDNTASAGGGAVYNMGVLNSYQSTLTTRSDFTDNHGDLLLNVGKSWLYNSTLYSIGENGSAISSNRDLVILSSVIQTQAMNNPRNNCHLPNGPISSIILSVLSDSSCTFGSGGPNIFGEVAVEPLAHNGGPTMTHRPFVGGAAKDYGFCDGLSQDQRGKPRIQGKGCDSGSVERQLYSLNISLLGNGSGKVIGFYGIDCHKGQGATCDVEVDEGVGLGIAWVADPGSKFAGWGGDCSGTGGCDLEFDAPKKITANFVLDGSPVYLPIVIR